MAQNSGRFFLILVMSLISIPGEAGVCWRDIVGKLAVWRTRPPMLTTVPEVTAISENPPEVEEGAAGHPLYFEVRGFSEGYRHAVLLIHGAEASGGTWKELVKPLLDRQVLVITPDVRGSGRTVYSGTDFNPYRVAQDLAALITRLRVGPVHVVGHSLGGRTAVALGDLSPEIVASVTVLDLELRQSNAVARNATYAPDIQQSWAVDLMTPWRALTMPTLFVATNPNLGGYVGERGREFIRGARSGARDQFIQWDDVGHRVHREQPERVADALLAFWENGG
jgi:pimeloyl-ACP methyl ester carboxylesterase